MAAASNTGPPKAHPETEDPQNSADMTAFVQNLLVQMQTRFQSMSDNIVGKIDEMGTRINELEHSIEELKTEMGAETTPPKPKPEETKTVPAE